MLAVRYGWTVAEIEALDVVRLADLVRYITDEKGTEKAFRQWLALLPVMSAGLVKFVEFNEFKDRLTGQSIDYRPAEEIYAEVEEVRRFVG